jgi:hypothetical protein
MCSLPPWPAAGSRVPKGPSSSSSTRSLSLVASRTTSSTSPVQTPNSQTLERSRARSSWREPPSHDRRALPVTPLRTTRLARRPALPNTPPTPVTTSAIPNPRLTDIPPYQACCSSVWWAGATKRSSRSPALVPARASKQQRRRPLRAERTHYGTYGTPWRPAPKWGIVSRDRAGQQAHRSLKAEVTGRAPRQPDRATSSGLIANATPLHPLGDSAVDAVGQADRATGR